MNKSFKVTLFSYRHRIILTDVTMTLETEEGLKTFPGEFVEGPCWLNTSTISCMGSR